MLHRPEVTPTSALSCRVGPEVIEGERLYRFGPFLPGPLIKLVICNQFEAVVRPNATEVICGIGFDTPGIDTLPVLNPDIGRTNAGRVRGKQILKAIGPDHYHESAAVCCRAVARLHDGDSITSENQFGGVSDGCIRQAGGGTRDLSNAKDSDRRLSLKNLDGDFVQGAAGLLVERGPSPKVGLGLWRDLSVDWDDAIKRRETAKGGQPN
jgi:hypothetical protein